MKKAVWLLLFLFAVPAYGADNDTPPPMPLDKQEQSEQLAKAIGDIDTLKAMIDKLTIAKKNECMKAFGNVEFCSCIAEKSPTGINFVQYVAITVATKEAMKYDQLSPDDKKMFDAARKSRDECVTWHENH